MLHHSEVLRDRVQTDTSIGMDSVLFKSRFCTAKFCTWEVFSAYEIYANDGDEDG